MSLFIEALKHLVQTLFVISQKPRAKIFSTKIHYELFLLKHCNIIRKGSGEDEHFDSAPKFAKIRPM